ncbi:signal transduction histidine kinase [Geopyxis carbonaria]|nr:signal transduction histidine kinase [Geopyxis carbonaria]
MVDPTPERNERTEDANELKFIDLATFDQILEMDDEGDDDFSRAIVSGFIEQAEQTFKDIEEKLEKKDLDELSSLGHFLKGSSATLGLITVKDYCEQIQHFGMMKDETGLKDLKDEEVCLKNIKKALASMRAEFEKARIYFKGLYPDEKDDSKPET